jgi:hypothetical protein
MRPPVRRQSQIPRSGRATPWDLVRLFLKGLGWWLTTRKCLGTLKEPASVAPSQRGHLSVS